MSLNQKQMEACLEAKRLGKPKPKDLPKYPKLEQKRNDSEETKYWDDRKEARKQTQKRGIENLKLKLKEIQNNHSNLPEPQLEKMLAGYDQAERDLLQRITRHEEGMLVAEALYKKNQWRETHKIEELKDSLTRVQIYTEMVLDALTVKPKKKSKKAEPKPEPVPELPTPPPIPPMELEEDEIEEEIDEDDEGEVVFSQCPICKKNYKTDQWVKRHMKDHHHGEYIKFYGED